MNTENGLKFSNFPKGADPAKTLNNKYAIVIKNGVPQYSKAFDGALDNSMDPGTEKLNNADENTEYYLYVDEDESSDNAFLHMIKAYDAAAVRNFKADFVFAVIMAALAVVLAVRCFANAGFRLEDGRVKRAFIDYVPADLHLLLSGGAITGFVLLLMLAFDELNGPYRGNFPLFVFAASIIIGVIWALFIELVTSIIRVCKSGGKLYKGLFIYKFLKFIIVHLVDFLKFAIVHLVIKPVKFILKKIKFFFSYKPDSFKGVFSRYVSAYAVIEALLFALEIIFSASDMSFFAAICGAVIVVFNAVLIILVSRYAIMLDKIITSSRLRKPLEADYNKLPSSLKALADSLKYTREELNVAVSKAVSNERMRSELITNVSHDLKTPLTSIITYVDLLKAMDIKDEQAREYISVLDEKSIRLKRLIDDLIEASKITSGVITLNSVNLSLTELAAQAAGERSGEFKDCGLDLVFDGGERASCFADGNKTFRILDNLLSNAKKYSQKGTRVYCSVYKEAGYSVFEIKNTSAQPLNISPDELKQRFVRGDRSRAGSGNGLGLSIADSLCEIQGGRLELSIDGDLFKARVLLPESQ